MWTAWSSAAAAWVGPGCSATWPTRSPGRSTQALPTLGEVAATVRRHAELLVGLSDEPHGCADLRKHMAWYFKGFPVGGELRRRLAMIDSLAALDSLLARARSRGARSRGPSSACPAVGRAPRGTRSRCRPGWLDDTSGRDLDLVGAELGISGG